MAKKTEYAWAIWNDIVRLYHDTVADTRECAIKQHVENGETPWDECHQVLGDRAVLVKVQVVTDRAG